MIRRAARLIHHLGSRPADAAERGQGVVEFTMVLPIILLVLVGMVEFGLVANDVLTIGHGSREGARAGSAMGAGTPIGCTEGDDPAGVDMTIVAAVQRIIKSQGSGVRADDIDELRIFKATTSGAKTVGRMNTWRYTGTGSGPDVDPGTGVSRLDFSPVTTEWPACSRINGGSNPDSLGVEVVYDRPLVTPLGAVMALFGGNQEATITLSETTIMALNPS